MQFHYDLSNAEPIIRDLPVGGSSDILMGAGISRSGAVAVFISGYLNIQFYDPYIRPNKYVLKTLWEAIKY